MKNRIIATVLLLFSLVVFGSASGQDGPNLNQVITVKVKPGRNAGFEEYIAAVRQVSQQLGMENYWLASQSVSGPPIYTFVLNRDSWSGLADPGPQPRMAEVLGEREAERLMNLLADSVESTSTAFYQSQPQISNPPGGAGPTPDAVIYTHITLNAGMAQQYMQTAAQTREAALAVAPDQRYIVQMPSFGATAVRVVSIVDSWTDLDGGRLGPGQMVLQHFGQTTGAALVAAVQETIQSVETVLNRARPDLQYQPED